MNRKTVTVLSGAFALGLLLTGCEGDSGAAKVSENISTAADNFEVQRKIIGINGITDTPAFEVEGRCSITDNGGNLDVICKHGEDDYRKHKVGLSDNVFYVSTQLDGIDASEYHTRIIIKPQTIIPDFDLQTSGGK